MRQRGPIIAGIACLGVILLVIFGLIMPKASKVKETNQQLAAAQTQQATLETTLHELQATQARAEQIRAELLKLDAAVPPLADLPDMIRSLNDIADQSGVDFISLAPTQPTSVPAGGSSQPGASPSPGTVTIPTSGLPVGISIVPATITIEGSYFAVDEYLFRLETLPRISKVTNINLAVGPKGYPQLALTIMANFYTTDTSAGPGSMPGAQSGSGAIVPATGGSTTGPTPTPSATPPSPTPSATQAG